MLASEPITAAENHVSRAAESWPQVATELELAAALLLAAGRVDELDAEDISRLVALRQKIVGLQANAKYAEALYKGLDQLDVVGYTPGGLEHAL